MVSKEVQIGFSKSPSQAGRAIISRVRIIAKHKEVARAGALFKDFRAAKCRKGNLRRFVAHSEMLLALSTALTLES